jgi:hypothetical protein
MGSLRPTVHIAASAVGDLQMSLIYGLAVAIMMKTVREGYLNSRNQALEE